MNSAKEFWFRSRNIIKTSEIIHKHRVKKIKIKNSKKIEVILDFRNTYEENLYNISHAINNKKMLKVFDVLLQDMYKFNFINCSIVSNNSVHYSGDYALLKDINLLFHSCGVFNPPYRQGLNSPTLGS